MIAGAQSREIKFCFMLPRALLKSLVPLWHLIREACRLKSKVSLAPLSRYRVVVLVEVLLKSEPPNEEASMMMAELMMVFAATGGKGQDGGTQESARRSCNVMIRPNISLLRSPCNFYPCIFRLEWRSCSASWQCALTIRVSVSSYCGFPFFISHKALYRASF